MIRIILQMAFVTLVCVFTVGASFVSDRESRQEWINDAILTGILTLLLEVLP